MTTRGDGLFVEKWNQSYKSRCYNGNELVNLIVRHSLRALLNDLRLTAQRRENDVHVNRLNRNDVHHLHLLVWRELDVVALLKFLKSSQKGFHPICDS